MRLLHTSDWHLGRSLETCRRYEEFAAFLDWLKQTIVAREVEALIVAGDIFDNTAPPNRAQELYYRFLASLTGTPCRHVVIVAGNHDSASFLDAPKEILRALNVHVVGSASTEPEDEVFVLRSPAGIPEAVVCAVPYLRDRDIRIVEAGESIEQKGARLLQGMRDHYARVCEVAGKKRQEIGEVPVVATGHLFTQGGKVVEEDGVRELYVGTLAHASVEMFPSGIDYLALGHLHVHQKVAGREHFRYSGSPVAMGFGEADQQKLVLLVDFSGRHAQIEEVMVPCFKPLIRVAGSFAEIESQLESLITAGASAWVEVDYLGSELIPGLQEDVYELVDGTKLELVRVKNRRLVQSLSQVAANDVAIEDINERSVFKRFLEMNTDKVSEAQWQELNAAYCEILATIAEEDSNRE